MSNVLVNTDFKIDGLNNKYTGKVRDVYKLKNDLLIIVVTDRISAFDVVLPKLKLLISCIKLIHQF